MFDPSVSGMARPLASACPRNATTMTGTTEMAGIDAHVIRFQCPKCGHELEQTIGNLKLSGHMRCGGCGVGINIDTNRLANAADEMRSAMEKVPPEITIKFFH
jgi:predicted RNA-binding Zn-ribbon protein involved in translation (DUF1610 family)